MIRADKVKMVAEMNEAFASTPHFVLATFRGLTVNQVNDLRGKISGSGGTYRVIKNRLARRAAEGTPLAGLSDQFAGPCALLSHSSDPVVLAKVLSEFIKDNPQIEMQAGVIESTQVLDPAGLTYLATLPGLPELQAQLLAMIQTPATMLVRLIGTPGTQIARVIDKRREAMG